MRKGIGFAIGLLVVAATTTSTTPVSASPACKLSAPRAVAINSDFKHVPVTFGVDCQEAGVTDGYWFAHHPSKGMQSTVRYDEADFGLYGFEDVGVWTWRPQGANDRKFNPVPQNRPVTDVRYATRPSMRVIRQGNVLQFVMKSSRYSAFNSWIDYRPKVHPRLQYRVPGGSWVDLRNVPLDAHGAYTWSYRTDQTRSYRMVIPASAGNPRVWGSTSTVVTP